MTSDGTITAAGGPTAALLGRPSSELIGTPLVEVLGPSADPRLSPPPTALASSQRQVTLPPPAGSPIEFVICDLFPGESRAVLVSPAYSSELSRTLRFNQELETSNRQLEAFAAVAAHDLQEPPRKIRAFQDRIRGMMNLPPGDPILDYLDRIDGAAGRMQVLISDLLALARISGRAPERTPSNLDDIVRKALADLADEITATGAEVTAGELPTITVDPAQFRQLFVNLISNSIKYRHPDRPPRVTVTATGGDGHHVITVTDNGIGFDDQYLPKIFEPFERLWGRDDYPGTGVGLALCREVVRRHGGDITAHGRPNEGADFVITLPDSTA